MSELEPEHDPNQADDEYLADAYAALDDDHRQQDGESAAETSSSDTSSAADTHTEEQILQPTTATTAPTEPGQLPVETDATDTTAEPSAGPSRRVFLIDGKEYPDPDSDVRHFA